MSNKTIFRSVLLGATLFLFSCADGRDDLPVSCDDVEWHYEGSAGPDHWGDLCPDFAACNGQQQSPINISGVMVDPALQALTMDYISSTVHIFNNGHTEQFTYDAGSSITVGGATYKLLQYHFHTHSEHAVDGQFYPMEMHLVHKNEATGKLAVVGILFEEGAENAFLQQFVAHLPAQAGETYNDAASYNVADVLPGSMAYYTYGGSLTTPPCSEIVTWIVLKQPVQASAAQLQQFEALLHENARPVVPLHGRTVREFPG
jgi:carbonic anhydrase